MRAPSDSALFIAGFDAVVGVLVFLYYRVTRGTRRSRLIPVSVVIIGALVNLSGLFCGPTIVKAVSTLGGLGLAALLVPYLEMRPGVPRGGRGPRSDGGR